MSFLHDHSVCMFMVIFIVTFMFMLMLFFMHGRP